MKHNKPVKISPQLQKTGTQLYKSGRELVSVLIRLNNSSLIQEIASLYVLQFKVLFSEKIRRLDLFSIKELAFLWKMGLRAKNGILLGTSYKYIPEC